MPNSGNSNSGNFSNDREKASEAGKKGGQSSSNTTQDRDKTSETGKKGGDSSHGGARKS
ncbi:KGG domain-containing protein [Pseudomonas sp. 10B1]|uniref:general stress protein n=1 Tax=unclassified Pseudomonas TaxID=196821 RepID=UPI002AB38873|nr:MULTISPECIES: KGG domain-containing protein [unclassified Pseudomonas]MDY7560857.1 KGG domain-containing protein [Pseudomonas sp. AB6]MEA9976475.1 KGG domain-containing protein [Pseudomonas sp. RTS4]MEA9996192.1 KGG domain-containing protein [Pseudomonas sp. AA4]MEB0088922.1 KGG domain-containing protein [Pseudomonas sp. RTI1]MEB0128032.1 KGG domain-containing protein [Pseudomonas sp. CCC1.2]